MKFEWVQGPMKTRWFGHACALFREVTLPPREIVIYQQHSDREDYHARSANLVWEHLFADFPSVETSCPILRFRMSPSTGHLIAILRESGIGSRLYKTQMLTKEMGFFCFTKHICIVFL